MNKIKYLFSKENLARNSTFITLLVLVILSVILGWPNFHKYQNIVNILRQVSYTGIIALGMTFVITGGGIDLSVGSMTAFVGGVTILVLNMFGESSVWGIVVACGTALVVGTLSGMFNGIIITKGRVASFIVTLGTLSVFRSLAIYLGNAGEFRSENKFYSLIGSSSIPGIDIPIPVIVFIFLAIVFHILLNHTKFGRYVFAVGSNERVAKYSAIKVNLIRFATYALTGLAVGFTAVLWSSRLNSVNSSNLGLFYELDAIAAVIIGGTTMSGGKGTVIGTVIGAIILGIINNMLNLIGISPYLQGTVKGLVIIIAVLLQYKRS